MVYTLSVNNVVLVRLLNSRKFKVASFIFAVGIFIFAMVISFHTQSFLRYGYLGVFAFTLFGSGLYIIPLLVTQLNPIWLALICSLGMSVNESLNWVIGSTSTSIIEKGNRTKKFETVINRYGLIGIFCLALIPFPFDIVGIVAGRIGIPYIQFVLTIFLARLLRFNLLVLGICTIQNCIT